MATKIIKQGAAAPTPQTKEALKAPRKLRAVPVVSQPHRKAPAVDPYLRPESITTEAVTIGDVTLPPIQRGIEPGLGLDGESQSDSVSVIWISRRQIEEALREVGRQHPDLETVLKIVARYMGYLDTMRSEAGFTASAAASWLKGDAPDVKNALEQLQQLQGIVGSWNDAYRLHVR